MNNHTNSRSIKELLKKIKFEKEGKDLDPDIFNSIAEKIAKALAAPADSKQNAPTQLRKFYDEVIMWNEKIMWNEEIDQDPEKIKEFLPFIRMLNAKAAYAKGRNHVDENFKDLIDCCVSQVDSKESMNQFKCFFEAIIGFYKFHRPSK